MNQQARRTCAWVAAAAGFAMAGNALAQDVAEKVNHRSGADFGPLPMMPAPQGAPPRAPVVAAPARQARTDDPVALVTVPIEAVLQGTVVVASHPAALANPQPPAVPVNLSRGYIGAPLIESRG